MCYQVLGSSFCDSSDCGDTTYGTNNSAGESDCYLYPYFEQLNFGNYNFDSYIDEISVSEYVSTEDEIRLQNTSRVSHSSFVYDEISEKEKTRFFSPQNDAPFPVHYVWDLLSRNVAPAITPDKSNRNLSPGVSETFYARPPPYIL